MTHFKKTLLFLAVPMLLGFTFLVFELYTTNSIKILAEKTAKRTLYNSGWTAPLAEVGSQPNPVYLGGLLYANIHAQNPNNGEWWAAGDYTSEAYKNGWRTELANNPRLAYMATQKFLPPFFSEFEKAMLANRESIIANWSDGAERAKTLNEFSRSEYWKAQGEVMDRYLGLIDDLLALDDAELDQKIKDIGTQLWRGSETTVLQQWVVDKGHLTKVPQEYTWGDPAHEGSWDYGRFPVDLLFMTHRVSRDFPDWTPRKFLTEARKFSFSVKSKLPK